MSEVTMLSAQFGALSNTVDQLNDAIIVLKTQMVNNGQRQVDNIVLELEQGELDSVTDFMKAFLERLAQLEHPDDHSAQLLPNAAVSQLNETVIAETADFFDQLRTIAEAIQKQQILTLAQFELLDRIVEALDEERSELFKKLRAARG